MSLNLQPLGLTSNQSTVYVALLRKGKSTATSLAKETGINRALIYTVLRELQEKSLCVSAQENGVLYFRASPPETLVERAKEQVSMAEVLAKQLLAVSVTESEDAGVRTYHGLQGMKVALTEQLSQKEFRVLGGGEEFSALTQHFYEQYYVKRIERNVRQIVLVKQQAKKTQKKLRETEWSTARILPSTYTAPMTIVLYANTTALFSWETKTAILIDSSHITNGFIQQFNTLWAVSQPL